MIDIVERLAEPEEHYPGNFDTPKRANAMLSCLCQEAKDEIESLRQQLANMTERYNVRKELADHLSKQLAEKDAEIESLRQQLAAAHQYYLIERGRADNLSDALLTAVTKQLACRAGNLQGNPRHPRRDFR